MTFPSITNRGEFFSNHYLDAIIGGDLGDLRKQPGDNDIGEANSHNVTPLQFCYERHIPSLWPDTRLKAHPGLCS